MLWATADATGGGIVVVNMKLDAADLIVSQISASAAM
jgi:hypothetical protein